MKRKFSNQNKDKKAELRRLVLVQLAKMRRKMKREHPGMLESLKEKIEAQKNTPPRKKERALVSPHDELTIDQGKNKQTIEKMLNLKSDNPSFEKAVKAILSQQK